MTTGRKTSGRARRRWSVAALLPRTVPGRRRLTAITVLISAGAAGYLATCALYPRPLFGNDRAVGRVIGMPISEAEQFLAEQGFRVKVTGEEADPEVVAGAVLWQDPPADLIAPQGTVVELLRSSGPALVPVPDLTGFDLDVAIRVLGAAGLTPGAIDSVPTTEPPGVLVGTRPAAGGGLAPGSTVDILVAEQAQGREVPNVVGLKREEAERLLVGAGFRVGRVGRAEGRRGPPGTIVEQRPGAGTRASLRSRVDLTITEDI